MKLAIIVVLFIIEFSAVFTSGCGSTMTTTETTTATLPPSTTTVVPPPDLRKAVRYLEGNMNGSINLLCESPDDSDSALHMTYWLANDNLVASYALKSYDSTLSSTLMSSVEKWGYKHDHYVEILFGNRSVEPKHAVDPNPIIIDQKSDHIIKTEQVTARIMPDYELYFDKLCYETLWDAYGGDRQAAQALFNQIPTQWDGKGFNDKGFNAASGYETYKLALCYYAAKAMNQLNSLPFKDTFISTIAALQAHNGGFYTHYSFDLNGNLQLLGSTNTETTSLVLIALNYQPKALP